MNSIQDHNALGTAFSLRKCTYSSATGLCMRGTQRDTDSLLCVFPPKSLPWEMEISAFNSCWGLGCWIAEDELNQHAFYDEFEVTPGQVNV